MKEELIDKEMEKQLEARREGQPLMPVVPLPVPKQPTQIEREEHELTHAKFAPWCEACIMGNQRPGRTRRSSQKIASVAAPGSSLTLRT